MGRENLVKWDSNSIFYKSLPGSGSLWGSLLSKIALYPSRWSLKSTVISWNAGSAERVMQSPHPLSESQSGEGLGSSAPLFVPPEMKKRHSSGSMSPSFIMILRHSTGHQMTLGFEKKTKNLKKDSSTTRKLTASNWKSPGVSRVHKKIILTMVWLIKPRRSKQVWPIFKRWRCRKVRINTRKG